jgi:predicted DNA-binding transcriptional regulator AlpA
MSGAINYSDSLLTEKQAASILGLTPDFLYRIRAGKGKPCARFHMPMPPPHVRFGRTVRYRRQDLDRWLDALASGSGYPTRRGRPTKAESLRRAAERNAADNHDNVKIRAA